MQRPLDGRAGADADHRAVAHQRGIERDGDIACRRQLAELRRERRIAIGERGGERTDRKPALQRGDVGQFRNERAVDEDEPAAFDIAEQFARRLGARLGRGIGRARQRLRLAHQRAQVGVLPVLDAAMRQAFLGEQVEGGLALRGDRVAAGQPRPRLRIRLRQRGLRRGLHHLYVSHGVHSFQIVASRARLTPPPPPDTRHSRALRVRAPIPCRRSSRCGPSTARAPRRARCS